MQSKPPLPSPDIQPAARVLYLDGRGRVHYARIVADLDGLFHARDCIGDLALTHGDIAATINH